MSHLHLCTIVPIRRSRGRVVGDSNYQHAFIHRGSRCLNSLVTNTFKGSPLRIIIHINNRLSNYVIWWQLILKWEQRAALNTKSGILFAIEEGMQKHIKFVISGTWISLTLTPKASDDYTCTWWWSSCVWGDREGHTYLLYLFTHRNMRHIRPRLLCCCYCIVFILGHTIEMGPRASLKPV